MAEDAPQEAQVAIGDEDIVDGLEKKKINGKVIVMAAGGLLVLIAAIVGVLSLFGGGGEDHGSKQSEVEHLAEGQAEKNAHDAELEEAKIEELKTLFVPIPPSAYDLKEGPGGKTIVRISFVLEVDRPSYKEAVEAQAARIKSELTVYVRELRPTDFDGAAGVLRMKEELLRRINQAVAPAVVRDVLFQDFFVQPAS